MIDKQLVSNRFSRAVESYDREAVAQKQIAHRLGDKLSHHLPQPCRNVLEIGCGTGFFTRRLLELAQPESLILNDICSDMSVCFNDLLAARRAVFMPGDAEQTAFPQGQDLIASCSAIQWFAAPERFFARCSTLLNTDGIFAFATFGQDNLHEVSTISGAGLPYRTQNELTRALSTHYRILETAEERITLTFGTPLDVLYHLKHTGVTGIKQQAWTKSDLQEFCRRYAQQYQQNQRVKLTYHPIYIIARKL